MKQVELTPAALTVLREGLAAYFAGSGADTLRDLGIAPRAVTARGAFAEALFKVEQGRESLETSHERLDRRFDRVRVLLFADQRLIGSAGLQRDSDGEYELEHVTIGEVEELQATLATIEAIDETSEKEVDVRLVRVPQLELTGLAVVPAEPEATLEYRMIERAPGVGAFETEAVGVEGKILASDSPSFLAEFDARAKAYERIYPAE